MTQSKSRSIADLRVYRDDAGEQLRTSARDNLPSEWQAVFNDFEELTGWQLGFCESPISNQLRASQGLSQSCADGIIYIEDLSESVGPAKRAIDRTASERLAQSLTALLHRYAVTCRAVHEDVEMQASGPTRAATDDRRSRRESIDRIATWLTILVDYFDYQSAAIGLLEHDERVLRFAHCIGPHFAQCRGQRRTLAAAIGDRQALEGVSLVLQRKSELEAWQAPVPCQSAVCLPLLTHGRRQGTLWLVSDRRRRLASADQTILELMAERIAIEIEATLAAATHPQDRGPRPVFPDLSSPPPHDMMGCGSW